MATKLFIGSLAWATTDDSLAALFSQWNPAITIVAVDLVEAAHKVVLPMVEAATIVVAPHMVAPVINLIY